MLFAFIFNYSPWCKYVEKLLVFVAHVHFEWVSVFRRCDKCALKSFKFVLISELVTGQEGLKYLSDVFNILKEEKVFIAASERNYAFPAEALMSQLY